MPSHFHSSLSSRALTAVASLLFVSLLASTAGADVTCCINYNNGQPCVSTCYVTDLTCADITIGFIIQSCSDNPIAGGGGTGNLTGTLATFDGQVNIGDGPFAGTVDVGPTQLTDFFFTRPVSLHSNLDQFIQVLGIDAGGNVYRADVPTAGLNKFANGDLVIQATRNGLEIFSPLEAVLSGRVATGDVTLTVAVIDRLDNTTALSFDYTPVTFSSLNWTFVGGGAVPSEQTSWGTMKAVYRY